MDRSLSGGGLVALGLLLSACQSTTASIQGKEDMLAAAGFTLQPANIPQRLAALKSLPAP
jgi:hypothetical protein